MIISKSGFYLASSIDSEIVNISDNNEVIIYDPLNKIKKITLLENSKLSYFSNFFKEGNYEKHIILNGENSSCKLRSFILSKKNKLNVKILGEVKSNNSKIDMNILSFLGEGGNINLDGIVKINKGVKKAEGFLNEENVFLGENAKIKGIPKLLVASNDIKAGHACKIEKIKDDDLFYLRSRGIEKEEARSMILKNYISKVFSDLGEINKDLCAGVVRNIFNKI